MMRSVNEIAALVLKAARGAGLDVGLAEDLSRASAWLPVDALAELSQILPNAEKAAGLTALNLTLDDYEATGRGTLPSDQIGAALATARELAAGADPLGPRDVPDPIWRALDDLAARTYVPASDASRLAGAGAGLTDND